GRSSTVALAVLDHARFPALHDGHAGIRGPEVDADYLSHWFTPQEIICIRLAALGGYFALPIQVEASTKRDAPATAGPRGPSRGPWTRSPAPLAVPDHSARSQAERPAARNSAPRSPTPGPAWPHGGRGRRAPQRD